MKKGSNAPRILPVKGVCILGVILLCASFVSNVAAEPIAFPGAEGFGRNAVGGRGGDVYVVTHLNDAGPGSFREAVSKGHRTVIFNVSGVIEIKDRVVVADHITIAGQTAPGDGVVIYGNGLSFSGADHTIVRYMRFRMGTGGDKGKDAVTIAEGSPMMFDHVSVSWGRDETFSISGKDGFFTIQDSIIAQGLQSHSCGGLLQNWGGISILRTLYIDNHTRNPKVKGVNQFINNVIYNWQAAGYILGGSSAQSHANVTGNYFIAGPQTGDRSPFTRGNENFHLYACDNYYDANRNGSLDGRLLLQDEYTVVDWQTQPFDYPAVKNLYTPQTACKMIISQAGASMPARDRVDHLLIRELTSFGVRGKIIADEKQLPTHGPGQLRTGQPPKDTDSDGMPDYWECSIPGLDVNKTDSNGDLNNDGYTNLEHYLNWLAAQHAVGNQNVPLNIDLKQFTMGFDDDAVYTLQNAAHGQVVLLPDGHTAQFTPATNYAGLAAFEFTVNDGDTVSCSVELLIAAGDK